MKRLLSVLLCLMIISTCFAAPVQARDSINLDISRDNISHEVSPMLYGAFIEDISKACDGGLVSNLIYNNSFEYNDTSEANQSLNEAYWVFDNISHEIKTEAPLNPKNHNYELLTVSGLGTVKNTGCVEHWDYKTWTPNPSLQQKADMGFKKDEKYDFSCYFKNIDFKGTVMVYLDSPSNSNRHIEIDISSCDADWRQISCELDSAATEDGGFAIEFNGTGSIQLDFVQLIPHSSHGYGRPEWKYATLRSDLYEALKNLGPAFLRFPGGCFCEGDSVEKLFDWKNTIGPVEEREQTYNVWRNDDAGDYYINSNFMGYGEYFNLCEDIGAEPVPCLNVGLTCQGRNNYDINAEAHLKLSMTDEEFANYLIEVKHYNKDDTQGIQGRIDAVNELGYTDESSWTSYLESIALTPGTPEWDNYVQDILDLIEYANGNSLTTYWGAIRSSYGHPEPYNLKYLELGNENWGEVYWCNFEELYKAVKEAYPYIQIITTAGAWFDGYDFDLAWNKVNEEYPDCYVDEHYYTISGHLYDINDRYDNYKRNAGKVFVGEYAATADGYGTMQTKSNIQEAIEEAAYMTGFERNGDVVAMTCYAPTLAKINSQNWTINEIWFDSQEAVLSPAYFTQLLFANNTGTEYIDASFDKELSLRELAQSVTVDQNEQVIYVKLVNSSDKDLSINLNISGFENITTASNLSIGNYFRSACNEAGKPCYIAPKESSPAVNGNTVTVEANRHSVNVVRIPYGSNNGSTLYHLPDSVPKIERVYIPLAIRIAVPSVVALLVVLTVSAVLITKAIKRKRLG